MGWMLDAMVGLSVGGVIGAVLAVNLVIYAGIDRGYEASIRDVFTQSPVVGVLTVTILVAGPVIGVSAMRFRRRRRRQP
jgi:hypothetical protein